MEDLIDPTLGDLPNPPAVIERGGLRIIVNDNLPPEANAMTMALYSRDPRSYLVHLTEVMKKGWQKFMAMFYVGYGHKSIGDCGSTNVCAEGVSMLGAKAIQDNELYRGQEASTRYMDMQAMRVMNPMNTEYGKTIQDEWMAFYTKALQALVPHLTEKYPQLEDDKQSEYEKAIKAKAFDIARGFLPAGCTTFVGWHTDLRQAWDHVYRMGFHPLPEVRDMSKMILEGLRQKYPSSFGFKSYAATDDFQEATKSSYYCFEDLPLEEARGFKSMMDIGGLMQDDAAMSLLQSRPPMTELPKTFKQFGVLQFRGLLDFGSFRDLQRHRGVSQVMPLLTTRFGFHPWYLESLPEDLRSEAVIFLRNQEERITTIQDPLIRQYYIAMGYQVPCQVTGALPGVVYLLELRSGQTVHHTLRMLDQEWASKLQRFLPSMSLHCDMGPDQWSTKRGKQDIVKKE